jgi:hypothetical protein
MRNKQKRGKLKPAHYIPCQQNTLICTYHRSSDFISLKMLQIKPQKLDYLNKIQIKMQITQVKTPMDMTCNINSSILIL